MAVFEYLEGWYNPHRRHSALGYLSPAAFERQAAERVAAEREAELALKGDARGRCSLPSSRALPAPPPPAQEQIEEMLDLKP